ncbi:MAG TPA: TlpA disulfide reductase family protein [Candidatus Methylacidiphilales bacterium]|jgi:peroxiredoxin|nr:TlpA disulfide reductase family protein [Candidatus Methylacidiphilales bacterium]
MKRTALFLLLLTAATRADQVLPAPQGGIRIIGGGSIIFSGSGVQMTPADAAPAEPTLRWKNGETLPGELVGASENDLTWKSPLFDDPLQLRWDVIDRIDWPGTSEQPKDPFAIALRDGSFIYGDLVAISADSVTIRSTRHGDAVLKRADVLSVRRRQNAKLVYAGPTGDLGWEAMMNQQDGSVARGPNASDTTSPVVTGPGGALLIRSWNRSAFLNVTMPEAFDVEFRLHSSKRPEFLVALGGNVREPLRVETWDNVLVLAAGDQFKIIRRIQDNERDIALRVCWDPKAQECSVFGPSGEEITTWKLSAAPAASSPGFIVQNRGLDLSLDMLRVRAWDGKAPSKIDLRQARVELDDGRVVCGSGVSGSQGMLSVQSPGESSAASFPLSDVDAVVFSSDAPQVPALTTSLAFNDDTLLFGHLAAIDNSRAAFATSFTSQPLLVQMDSPRQLLTSYANQGSAAPAVPGPSLEGQDTISIQDTTLHGKLGTTADGALGWLPAGGVKPARPAGSLAFEITRAVPKDAPLPADPALFYLNSGDILPGNLRSLDRTGVEFESSLMDARQLPSAQLEAIEFSPATRLNVQGFNDPAWQIVKGDDKSVRRDGNSLQMDAGAAISMSSLMQCGDFSFKYNPNGFSATRVRLFTAGKDVPASMNVLLCSTGGQFTTGLESTPGQLDNQFQIRTQPGAPVTVRFKMENNTVELLVNDISAGQFPVDPANCPGSGVILEPASIWGNGVFTVSLSDFSAHSVVGRAWLPEVNEDIRKQVLTVPRFERDDPPRHLLLAANGDVLRGEIEAATDTHFGFRCGLENLTVPRERVRAVIWLQPPSKDAATGTTTPAAAPDNAPSANPLQDRIAARMAFRQIDLSSVLNFLRSQDHGLKIEAPDEASQKRIEAIRLGGQTIAEALTTICATFDLHYRLDPDNSVVLELPGSGGGGGLIAKSYWIKPDALPATASAQDTLSAKGIDFPKGASVDWRPNSGVLNVVNTAANQSKLAALLASDFGGCLGSPTHWVELTSGGRLALAVDKFAPDFIYAHQPAYGAIKVPMAQVATIRTTAPPPTTASRALEDWHLVNAPEPVIPTGGGENSPLLGKDAPTFTLPQLVGGDFDLASEKGHVVVLDFWASWCGPCVRSLPGLVDLVATFPSDKVKLIGINQGEAPEQVKHFLEARGLKLRVALDADQSVGRKYGVDAIPRTIVVGPDGKVAWEQTGYDPDGEAGAAEVIKKLLAPAPGPAQ